MALNFNKDLYLKVVFLVLLAAFATALQKNFKSQLIFRVLRHDETSTIVSPRNQLPLKLPIENAVERHINYGSNPEYESNLVSFTAELNVALAFGGCVSRIAVADLNNMSNGRYIKLDKDYLRHFLTDKTAQKRSRRSDEVLLADSVPATILPVTLLSVQLSLTPGYESSDSKNFPTADEMEIALKPENLISISGANQRFFEIEMNDGRRFIVHPSRPNYCLESSILFGDELVKLCKCEFTNYGTYRAISPDSVPKCAMYTCNLQYELDDSVVTFPWPILVFEHFGFCDLKKEDLFDTALDLFAPDILLGNWACREDEEKLTKGSEAIYARRSSDDGIIRVSVDRALGCTYPEDRQKNKQALSGCEFDDDPHDMINALRNDDSSRWLYGGLRKKDVDEIFMKILQDGALYEKICSIIDVSLRSMALKITMEKTYMKFYWIGLKKLRTNFHIIK
jgi:hypothetical protein